ALPQQAREATAFLTIFKVESQRIKIWRKVLFDHDRGPRIFEAGHEFLANAKAFGDAFAEFLCLIDAWVRIGIFTKLAEGAVIAPNRHAINAPEQVANPTRQTFAGIEFAHPPHRQHA